MAALVFCTGCGPLYVNARNTIAAANGLIVSAQALYLGTCTKNPQQGTCVLINKGIDAVNVAITLEETYCGFAFTPTQPSPTAVCNPVASASTGLSTALANLTTIIAQIKPLVNSKSTSELMKEYDKPVTVTYLDLESLRMEAM